MIKRTFEFAELSYTAQQTARGEFQRDRDYSLENELLREYFDEALDERGFPNEDVEYSLSYSQGDGVAFYGRIDVDAEMLQRLDLPDDERMFLERAIAAGWTVDFEIERNHWATHYAHWNTMTLAYEGDDVQDMAHDVFAEEIEDGEEAGQCEEWMLDAIEELERKLTERVVYTSRELEAEGYTHFDYCDSDEYIDEVLSEQGDIFNEDGTIAEEEQR